MASPRSDSTPEGSSGNPSNEEDIVVIVGAVAGGIFVLVVMIAVIVVCYYQRTLKRSPGSVPWSLRQLALVRVRRDLARARRNTYQARPQPTSPSAGVAPPSSPVGSPTPEQRERMSRPLPDLPPVEDIRGATAPALSTRRLSAPPRVSQDARRPAAPASQLSPSRERRPLPPLPAIAEPVVIPEVPRRATMDCTVILSRPNFSTNIACPQNRPLPELPIPGPSQTTRAVYTAVKKNNKSLLEKSGTGSGLTEGLSDGSSDVATEMPAMAVQPDIQYDLATSSIDLPNPTIATAMLNDPAIDEPEVVPELPRRASMDATAILSRILKVSTNNMRRKGLGTDSPRHRPVPEVPIPGPSQTPRVVYTAVKKKNKSLLEKSDRASGLAVSPDNQDEATSDIDLPNPTIPIAMLNDPRVVRDVYNHPTSNDPIYDDTLPPMPPDNPCESNESPQSGEE